MMQPVFYIELAQLNGSRARLEGMSAWTTVESLYLRVGELSSSDVNQFSLVYDGTVLLLTSQLPLCEVGISHLDVVTMVHIAQPRVFWRGLELERHMNNFSDHTRENHQRLILDFNGPSTCCLVSLDRSAQLASLSNCAELFDVISATYHVEECVIVCCWERHVQRHLRVSEGWRDHVSDSGWEEMALQASFKWRRLPCPGMDGDADDWHELANHLTEKILQDELQALCEMDVSGGSLLGIPVHALASVDEFRQRSGTLLSDPSVSKVETVMEQCYAHRCQGGCDCAVFRVAGSAQQKNVLLQEFGHSDVSLFLHELKIKVALYTHSFASCVRRRRLAGEVIKTELTRLQQMSSTWKQTLSKRVMLDDLIFLEELSRENWRPFYSSSTETYTEEREKIRHELAPLADMLDLPLPLWDFNLPLPRDWWYNVRWPFVENLPLPRAAQHFQDISFEFNPHDARSADVLLEIGYHADELALAACSFFIKRSKHILSERWQARVPC